MIIIPPRSTELRLLNVNSLNLCHLTSGRHPSLFRVSIESRFVYAYVYISYIYMILAHLLSYAHIFLWQNSHTHIFREKQPSWKISKSARNSRTYLPAPRSSEAQQCSVASLWDETMAETVASCGIKKSPLKHIETWISSIIFGELLSFKGAVVFKSFILLTHQDLFSAKTDDV